MGWSIQVVSVQKLWGMKLILTNPPNPPLKKLRPVGYSELLGDRHGPRRPAVHVILDLESPQDTQNGQTLLTHQEVAKVFKALCWVGVDYFLALG